SSNSQKHLFVFVRSAYQDPLTPPTKTKARRSRRALSYLIVRKLYRSRRPSDTTVGSPFVTQTTIPLLPRSQTTWTHLTYMRRPAHGSRTCLVPPSFLVGNWAPRGGAAPACHD